MAGEVSGEVDQAFQALAEALQGGKLILARALTAATAERNEEFEESSSAGLAGVREFQREVKALCERWAQSGLGTLVAECSGFLKESGPAGAEFRQKSPEKQRTFGPRGDVKRTPQEAFRLPILRVLAQLGGRAKKLEVIERVYNMMKSQLTADDLKPLAVNRDARWFNTASWERQNMTHEGLLAKGSPRGIWEITEQGREYLRQHEGEA